MTKLISITILVLAAYVLNACSVTLGLDLTDPKTGTVAKFGVTGDLPTPKGLRK